MFEGVHSFYPSVAEGWKVSPLCCFSLESRRRSFIWLMFSRRRDSRHQSSRWKTFLRLVVVEDWSHNRGLADDVGQWWNCGDLMLRVGRGEEGL